MNTKNLIILVVGVMVVGVAIQSRSRRGENARAPAQSEPLSTRRMLKPRLPAPRMPIAPASVPEAQPSSLEHTNAFVRLLSNDGNPPELSRAQVESYVAENQRSAESLLAAFRLTRDRALLQEAVAKYPNEPRVCFAAWVAARAKEDASPEERRQWLDAFKQSAPANALANYLSAQDYFESGQTDRAVEDLNAAANNSKFQDYSADYVQSVEEAYLDAGYSTADAKAAAAYSISLPQLSEMRHLSESLRDLVTLYRQAGDEPSLQTALQMGLDLGRRLDESVGGSLVTQNLVGLAIERRILGAVDPNTLYGSTGQTVQNQLESLTQRVDALKGLWKQAEPVLQNMPNQELVSYFDRMKTFGESEALRWVMNRQGKP